MISTLTLLLLMSTTYVYASDIYKKLDMYPKGIFEGISDEGLVRPNPEYEISPPDLPDTSKISAVSFRDLNSTIQSVFSISTEESKDSYWGNGAYNVYTIVDWRQFKVGNSKPFSENIYKDDTSELGKLDLSSEARRAVNVLGERAFLVEDVDPNAGNAWNSTNTLVNMGIAKKSIALMATYKAIGRVHTTPPLIHMTNLDDREVQDDKESVPIVYTSLASSEEAQRYSFYDVMVKDAVHWAYVSPNLMEGYLYDAIQDGIISETELTDRAKKSILGFVKPELATNPLKIISKFSDNIALHSEEQPMLLMSYTMRNGRNGKYPVLKVNPDVKAFKDETITTIEFLTYLKKIMDIQGEPSMLKSEEQTLAVAYGSRIAPTMSEDYYNTILYLISRGIVDDSVLSKLYNSLTYEDMYVYLSRVADKDSRLVFKTLTIPFDLRMMERHFTALSVRTDSLDFGVKDITYTNDAYYDLLILKEKNSTFLDGQNQPVRPYISKSDDFATPAYGVLLNDNLVKNDLHSFYHFRIYKNEPVPKSTLANKMYNTLHITSMSSKLQLTGKDNLNTTLGGVLKLDSTNTLIEDPVLTSQYFDNNEFKFLERVDTSVANLDANGIAYLANTEEEKDTETKLDFTITTNKIEGIKIFNQTLSEWVSNPLGVERTTTEEQPVTVAVSKGEKPDEYNVIAIMKSEIRDDPMAIISQSVSSIDNTSEVNVAYVRRGYEKDVYYSRHFVETTLKGKLIKHSDILYEIALPDATIKIVKDTTGWKCISGNVSLTLASTLPAIQEKDEDTVLVHSFVLEEYLRTRYKIGYSKAVTADGVLHLREEDLKFKAEPSIELTPILGVGGKKFTTENLVFSTIDVNTDKYLDLTSIPSLYSNTFINWKINSVEDIVPTVVSVYPKGIFEVSDDFNRFYKLIEAFDIDTSSSDGTTAGLTYYTTEQYIKGDKAKHKTPESYLNERLIIDTETFSVMYKLPNNVSDLETIVKLDNVWQLPYVYDDVTKKVTFCNLPYRLEKGKLVIYENDIKEEFFLDINPALKTDILGRAIEFVEGTDEEIPVASIPTDILSVVSEHVTPQKWADISFDAKLLNVGPYYEWLLTKPAPDGEIATKMPLSNWVRKLLGMSNVEKLTTNIHVLASNNTIGYAVVKPLTEGLVKLNKDSVSKFRDAETPSMLATNIVGTLLDKIDTQYDNHRSFMARVEEFSVLLHFVYMFVVVLIPRFLIYLLVLIITLSLARDWIIYQNFCDRWFDPMQILTLGRYSSRDVNKGKAIVQASVAIVILAVVAEGLVTQVVIKLILSFT